jgi:hypothetical protein
MSILIDNGCKSKVVYAYFTYLNLKKSNDEILQAFILFDLI